MKNPFKTRTSKITVEKVRQALIDAEGNQVQASIALGCTARTISNYTRDNPDLKDIIAHYRGNKNPRRNTTLDEVEKALRETGGFFTRAAELLNVTQSAVSQRVSNSVRLQNVLKEIEEQYLDLGESKLMSLINKEDLGAIKFYLRCKGARRGYIERSHLNVATPGDQTWEIKRVIIDPDKSNND